MGIAAYNRGSRAITAQIDAAQPDWLRIMVDGLNNLPCPDASVPFYTEEGLTLSPGHGGWWLTCNVTGFGYWAETPWKLMRAWSVRIVRANAITRQFHCVVDASRKNNS